MPPVLILDDIHLTFGGTPLLEGAALSVDASARICLVGRNGSGKSTLLKIAAGLIEPDRGERFIQPGVTVRYLPQEPDFSGFATTLDYVEAGLGPGDDPHRARYLLEHLGLKGDEDPARLSGGEARRAALACVLAPEPDILLLDEPTNHLDLTAIEWLEEELKARRSALVVISHDRRLLQNMSQATIWLRAGMTRRLDQGFAAFEDWRDAILAEEDRDRQRLKQRIKMEEDWLRYGVTARRKRNQGRLRGLQALRVERQETRKTSDSLSMTLAEGKVSGKLVIEAEKISKSYSGRAIVEDFSTRILRADRIGLIGPNGAGKTTLLKLLTGALAPDSGTVRLGANLEILTLDQRRESLDPEMTLSEALTGGGDQVSVNGAQRHVMSYMQDFLFAPEQARTPIRNLSGGERGRLMIARAFAKPSNLMVLDEPTNDFDIETLDLLQEKLADYPGTVLLVSHDRDFLDRVVTSVIAPEGDGKWLDYAGGYSDLAAQRTSKEKAENGKPRKAVRPRAERVQSKRKLSFKEKHVLEALPGRIERLEMEIATLEAALAESGLYARDRAQFDAKTARLDAAQAEREQAETDWLTLEMLREELEG